MTINNHPSKTGQRLIAVTGGIGSGKSVVCRILSSLGYPVYDCDSRAKALMAASEEIKEVLRGRITPDAVNPDGTLNRAAIAEVVFSNPDKLAILDRTVHAAVNADIAEWRETAGGRTPDAGTALLFIESAIPFKSGLHKIVDDIWEVAAPEEVRVARAVKRDNVSEEAVRKRIASQAAESPAAFATANPSTAPSYRTILNDGASPLLPQILNLIEATR